MSPALSSDAPGEPVTAANGWLAAVFVIGGSTPQTSISKCRQKWIGSADYPPGFIAGDDLRPVLGTLDMRDLQSVHDAYVWPLLVNACCYRCLPDAREEALEPVLGAHALQFSASNSRVEYMEHVEHGDPSGGVGRRSGPSYFAHARLYFAHSKACKVCKVCEVRTGTVRRWNRASISAGRRPLTSGPNRSLARMCRILALHGTRLL